MNRLNHILYEVPVIHNKCPVVIIGAGGIVKNAHLPAYQIADIPVAGIFDIDHEKARELAREFNLPLVYNNLDQLVQQQANNCIYDIAVPGTQLVNVLGNLPDNSFVLMQKPMGENLQQAEQILELCRRKNITAAVNFQLRYAPYIQMARQIMKEKLIGEVCNIEVYINTYTPWQQWPFLTKAPRLEILYHSIHYIDLVRNLLGNPVSVFAHSTKHPAAPELQAVRSDIIMNYGPYVRVGIFTNHMHNYGAQMQDAYIKIEGTQGAVKIKLGLLLDYPAGKPDKFECILAPLQHWHELPIYGSWFPHAFIGSMHEMIKVKNGEQSLPDNSVEDCIYTMRLVEQAYNSTL
ncbi:MAG: Gfo/Idh/MocA family protein [Agriterribacter sp.]